MAAYTPILATLGYVMSPDGTRVLMIHRNARENDQHYGKYNGLGGKLEPFEDAVSGMRREIREEAGIEADEMALRGTLNWPGFGKNGEDWFAFVFRIDRWSGTPFERNPEGTLEWVEISRMTELNLWESDRMWLHMVFERTLQTFHGIAPYEGQRLVSWDYTLI
jgi:8-oxo-dGTP diphosphatase